MSDTDDTLRPADLALLIIASGDLLPRQRARDQQADLGGADMKRRMLNELVIRDPEPEALTATLEQIIAGFGPPEGPTRAIALSVLGEWQMAQQSPAFVEWLLAQAIEQGQGEGRRGRKNRQSAETPDA